MKISKFKSLIAAALLLSTVIVGRGYAAGTASFTLGSSAGTVSNGSSVSVAIYENGMDVNAVTVKLSYDASKLSCDAGSIGGGAFASQVSATCGGGSATISRYTAPGSPALSGSQLVGSITFRALAGSGSTSVAVAPGSQIASNGANIWNGSLSSTGFSFVTPAAAPAAPVAQKPAAAAAKPATTPAPATATGTAPVTSSESGATPTPVVNATNDKKETSAATSENKQPTVVVAGKKSNPAGKIVGSLLLIAALSAAAIYAFRRSTFGKQNGDATATVESVGKKQPATSVATAVTAKKATTKKRASRPAKTARK